MAAAQVFSVPELLESILLQLPAKRLFVFKAVGKLWKLLIEDSIHLKRATFLAPKGSVIPVERQIKKYGIPWYRSDTYLLAPLFLDEPFEPTPCLTYYFNPPGIDLAKPEWPEIVFEDLWRSAARDIVHGFSWGMTADKGVTFPQACQSMLLTQPPMPNRSNKLCVTLYRQEGVTLGMIERACAQMLEQLPPEHRTRILGECPDGGMYRLHGVLMMECSKVLLFRQAEINRMKRDNHFKGREDVSDLFYQFDWYRKVGYHELNHVWESEEDLYSDY